MNKFKLIVMVLLLLVFIVFAWKAREVDWHKNLKPAILLDQQ